MRISVSNFLIYAICFASLTLMISAQLFEFDARLHLYLSFFCISTAIIRDYLQVKYLQILNIRIFILLGVVLWYYLPILLGDYQGQRITETTIYFYSISLVFCSRNFELFDDNYKARNFLKYLALFSFIYMVYKVQKIDGNILFHILKSRNEMTSDDFINTNGNLTDTLLAIIDVFYYVILSFGLMVSFVLNKKGYLMMFLVLIVAVSIESGFRTLMAFLLSPILVLFLSKGRLFALLILGVVLLLGAKYILLNRNQADNSFDNLNMLEAAVNTSDLYSETDYVLSNLSSYKDVAQNDLLIYTTYLLPRSIFEWKPFPEVIKKFSSQRWGIDITKEGGNVFPGLYMNFYVSYGFLGGIIAMLAFFYITSGLIALIYSNTNSFLAISLYSGNLLLNFRSNSPMFFYYSILAFLMVHVISKYFFRYEFAD